MGALGVRGREQGEQRSFKGLLRRALHPADCFADEVNISRTDIVLTRGYVAWLFWNNDVQDWHRGLRMPLIQEALGLEMNVPMEEVMVGVYGFQQQVVDQGAFTLGEVRSAYTSPEDLLRQLGL